MMNIEKKELKKTRHIDDAIHKLVHQLLVMGETDPQKLFQIHMKESMI